MELQLEMLLERSFHIVTFLKEQCGNDPNFIVNKIVQNWVQYNFHRGRIECEMCSDAYQSIGYCVECCWFLDEQCIRFHKKIKKLMKHTIFEFKRENRILKIRDMVTVSHCDREGHQKAEQDSYCVTCKSLLCRKCLKRHIRKGHRHNSIKELYHLLDEIYSTKIFIENIIDELPRNQQNTGLRSVLSTIVQWSNKTLRVQADHSDISDVMLPSLVTDMLRRSGSLPWFARRNYMSCKAVLEKMWQVQRDLQLIKSTSRQSLDGTPRGAANENGFEKTSFSYAPYMPGDISGDSGSYTSSSSSNSTMSNENQNQNTVPSYHSYQLSPLTETHFSCNSYELFPPEDAENEQNEDNVHSSEPEELKDDQDTFGQI